MRCFIRLKPVAVSPNEQVLIREPYNIFHYDRVFPMPALSIFTVFCRILTVILRIYSAPLLNLYF